MRAYIEGHTRGMWGEADKFFGLSRVLLLSITAAALKNIRWNQAEALIAHFIRWNGS